MNTLPFPGSGDDAPRPRRFGRYEILDRIGHGSMGIVYLAQDPLIGRRVALKTLAEGRPLEAKEIERLRSRLLNEAASAGRLSHPGIVTIHDVVDDEATGQVCIAMEYVAGRTLKEYLQKRDILSLQFTAEMLGQVAEVLDFAHARGVVHRDVKPANVMLAEDGKIKITDFGIASLRGQDLAQDLRSMGTPNYLAPERLLGFEADHRADVYSLGVLLYEMLTGHVPFQGESLAELARNTVEEDFTPPEIYRPDLLPGLRAILDRALAKEPDDRYQSAGDLAADLRAVVKAQSRMSDTRPVDEVLIEGRATTPRAPAGPGLAAHLAGAVGGLLSDLGARAAGLFRGSLAVHPRRLALWIGAGALLLFVVSGGVWLASRPEPGAPPAAPGPSAAEAQAELQQLRYTALLSEVERLYRGGNIEEAEALLAEAGAPEPARIERLRQEAHFNVEADRAVRQVAQVLELLEATSEAIDRGSLATAEAALFKVRQLDPENEEAAELERRLSNERRAIVLAQRRSADELAAAAAVEAAPRFEPFSVSEAAAPPPADPLGTLRIDFQSEVPRGVLTVYLGSEQILRREFSFFERRNLFRRRAVEGGFEEDRRVAAGTLPLRVYLAVPGDTTLSRSIEGQLPGGGVRVLTVRVDAESKLSLGFR
jgi:serine/threonine-protein kinase